MLTEFECRNAQCPEGKTFLRIYDGGGLYLQVTRSGSKLWRFKYQHRGKEKVLALGRYPQMSLARARKERDAARERLREGVDPSAARREAREATKNEPESDAESSFERIALAWYNDWRVGKAERHASYTLRRLRDNAFPLIGARDVGELKAKDFVRIAKTIEARGAGEVARRVLHACSQIMRYAVAHGLAERNPVADVRPGDFLREREKRNFARIEVRELPELLRRIVAYPGSAFTRIAMHLMALTFVRTSELILARWKEFDLEKAEWRIPAERMKGRHEHFVPLSRQAVELLRCLQEARGGAEYCSGDVWVFPGERSRRKPMSNNTILKALERMGYKGRMTGHGFRGVASTALNEMGYRPDVIEAQLAHVEADRVRAAYNKAKYAEERREMMQAWADYLDAVRQSGQVIPIRSVRAEAA